MAAPPPGPAPIDVDVKTQFSTREGTYRLLAPSEYSRPNRVPLSTQASNPVRVSFANVDDHSDSGERICFNVGRELYFYIYKGVRKVRIRRQRRLDLNKPIDKRIYKGTQPTCHDINQMAAGPESIFLLVGFTTGQVQLVDPVRKENSKLFNEERLIDKTRVTCIKWLPASESLFLVSHASGQMYLYNEELACGSGAPGYTQLKHGETFTIYTSKSKSVRNPLLRWAVGSGAINEFAFSPDSTYLACASQDGFLRVFHFEHMELYGSMRSYFGGLLCVCWSPDGCYIATGGEDDLVTVWSFVERRVVARGHGHRSWVSVVAFDPYTTSIKDTEPLDFSGSDEEFGREGVMCRQSRANSTLSRLSQQADDCPLSVTYRFGSVGHDTQLCLWDLTEDVLFPHQPLSHARTQTNITYSTSPIFTNSSPVGSLPRSNSLPHSVISGVGHFATMTLQDYSRERYSEKEHKRNCNIGRASGKSGERTQTSSSSSSSSQWQMFSLTKGRSDSSRLLGSPPCPHMHEVPVLEPLVCKKIARERLTVLQFLEDCVVTACQEGFICTWVRPGRGVSIPISAFHTTTVLLS
uniref:WD repeat-containing protein 20 n=1 Tax=Eptatretus burgeri TaxID=7764 RepID=A0A8C4QX92_EPTBU